MLLRIRQEIEQDPDGVGYAGKTDAEIVRLLNSHRIIQVVTEETRPSPINRILSGMANSDNAITIVELTQAKVVT